MEKKEDEPAEFLHDTTALNLANLADVLSQFSGWQKIGLYFEESHQFVISYNQLKARKLPGTSDVELCWDLLQELAHRNIRVEELATVLHKIGRDDIATQIKDYKKKQNNPAITRQPSKKAEKGSVNKCLILTDADEQLDQKIDAIFARFGFLKKLEHHSCDLWRHKTKVKFYLHVLIIRLGDPTMAVLIKQLISHAHDILCLVRDDTTHEFKIIVDFDQVNYHNDNDLFNVACFEQIKKTIMEELNPNKTKSAALTYNPAQVDNLHTAPKLLQWPIDANESSSESVFLCVELLDLLEDLEEGAKLAASVLEDCCSVPATPEGHCLGSVELYVSGSSILPAIILVKKVEICERFKSKNLRLLSIRQVCIQDVIVAMKRPENRPYEGVLNNLISEMVAKKIPFGSQTTDAMLLENQPDEGTPITDAVKDVMSETTEAKIPANPIISGANNDENEIVVDTARQITVTADKENLIVSIVFSVHDNIGSLREVLGVMKKHDLNMTRIESRPSTTREFDYDFFVDFSDTDVQRVLDFTEELRTDCNGEIISIKSTHIEATTLNQLFNIVPWFPRKIKDLDTFADKLYSYGAELNSDHPGFKDKDYVRRRSEIAKIAGRYRTGNRIPRIDYNESEIDTWRTVYRKLKDLFPTHACKQHTYVFPLLEQNCGYSEDNIPQLQDVSDFLQDCTGWTLRPTTCRMPPREFLNSFAFRIYPSAQYIRHHSQPLYTPERDVCQELLGHVPLLADPDFADFLHEIGLASLGASDEEIERLSTVYWFTAEFGLCKEGYGVKAYGAGLLSSFGELDYCLTDKPEKKPFDPLLVATTKYPTTEYQPLYFVTESFEDATNKIRQFVASFSRPFIVRYNPYTMTAEIIDNKHMLMYLANNLKSELHTWTDAINTLNVTSMYSV